jgi:tetrahydromethanopterin S-methyltransferase subunit B
MFMDIVHAVDGGARAGAARSRLIAVPTGFTEVERQNPLWTSQRELFKRQRALNNCADPAANRRSLQPMTEKYGSLPNRRNRIIVKKIVGSSRE